jgi:ABC-type dipeptide/oligopeptide/nickel transport system ATPase component
MIFPEPSTALNPVLTVGRQITEVIERHAPGSANPRQKALDLLRSVGIPDPERRFDQYPFELSGGLKQRVMIAGALAVDPEVLIADEPTTALDVTIQAQILHLLRDLQKEFRMGMILITHDLGIVARVADRVCVMYAGQFVEQGTVQEVFRNPLHPYTRGLFRSIPKLRENTRRLVTIDEIVRNPDDQELIARTRQQAEEMSAGFPLPGVTDRDIQV